MKTLFTALAITALSVSQSGSGSIAGSWTAEFEGQTFIRLEINTANGLISGGLSLGRFEVDQRGVVRRADPAPRDLKPIFDVTIKGSTVTFLRKDGHDTDQFELRLLENANADLHFLLNDGDRTELAASGVPVPKPIRLKKAG